MLKPSRSLAAGALALSLTALAFRSAAGGDAIEHEAVERAVRDYVEALYEAKPELIERSVHPKLEKVGLYRPDDSESYSFGKMTFDQLHSLAGVWNKDGAQAKELAYEIEVHEVLDVTASARLSADWGIDHMHLSKSEGSWKILQILWQSHPPTK